MPDIVDEQLRDILHAYLDKVDTYGRSKFLDELAILAIRGIYEREHWIRGCLPKMRVHPQDTGQE